MTTSDRIAVLLLLFAAGIGVFCMNAFPLWWDEGWNFVLAKNWLISGLYGEQLKGEAQAVTLAGSPLVVLPIALSFAAFGIGAWQARLAALFFLLATLSVFYLFTRRSFGRLEAVLTLLILLLASGHVHLYAPMLGTQAVGEMPMLFFVIAGYLCIARGAPGRSLTLLSLGILSWSFAYYTKNQVRPFLMAASALPLVYALFLRSKSLVALYASLLLFPMLLTQGIHAARQYLLSEPKAGASVSLDELYTVTALVLDSDARKLAFDTALYFAIPAVLGLLSFAVCFLKTKHRELDSKEAISGSIRLSLWTLAASWFAWYLLLSAGWPRYLFPALFLSAALSAQLIATGIRSYRNDPSTSMLPVSLAVALVLALLPGVKDTISLWLRMAAPSPHASSLEAASLINEKTPEGALVETYETELFFLLERDYHHPPDSVHIALNKRRFLKEKVPIDYDPLAADPQFLIVGPVARSGGLYLKELRAGAFAPLTKVCHAPGACPYTIYRRLSQ